MRSLHEADAIFSKSRTKTAALHQIWNGANKPVRDPEYAEIQPDGRIRHWRYIDELGKYLRVITLGDGETLHNAFPDRRFKPK